VLNIETHMIFLLSYIKVIASILMKIFGGKMSKNIYWLNHWANGY